MALQSQTPSESLSPPLPGRVGTAPRPWSVVGIIAGNLVPLAGVLLFGWSVPAVLVMYWIETGVVGPVNALRILKTFRLTGTGGERTISRGEGGSARVLALGWLATYLLFWLVLGGVVLEIAGGGFYLGASRTGFTGVPLDVVAWGTAGLVGGQLLSYYHEYVRGRRYLTVSSLELLRDPFVRVFVLFGAVALGGVGTALAGAAIGFLVALIVVKTVIEVRLLSESPWRINPG